jgi:alpha-L-rhamnosidase
MQAYVDVWIPQWENGRLVDSNLGDHLSPSATVNQLVSTAYYAQFAAILADVAELAGRPADAQRYRALRTEIRDAFNAAYFDRERGIYRQDEAEGFVQTSNLLPLAFDLVAAGDRDRVAAAVVADVEARGGNLSTGVVGTRFILTELTAAGYPEVAFRIATQSDFPSWGQWLDLGYTALAENWGPAARSLDHHFFGSIGQWLFESVAGIQPIAPGYREIAFRPGFGAEGLDSAAASIETPSGTAAVCWERTDAGFLAEVRVPPNTAGTVYIPVDRADLLVSGGDGVELLESNETGSVFRVTSGQIRFSTESFAAEDECRRGS